MDEIKFEKKAIVLALKVFRSEIEGDLILPVLLEHAESKDDFEDLEYFRARTVNFASGIFGGLANTRDSVSVMVCHNTKSVKFGPKGHIIVTNNGRGVGSALMSSVIGWLQSKRLDDYQVRNGDLAIVDARTQEDQERRNRFYMRHGFRLSDKDGADGVDVKEGSFGAKSVACLIPKLREGTSILEWKELNLKVNEYKRNARSGAEYRLGIGDWYRNLGGFSKYFLRKSRFPG